ncbi:hypothetical protein [Streptomyces syringium]|uniref:hypothetical protein n=1 Tax=Streptomyces syringium TaxID=76729 RepID=UPI003456B84A
MFSFLGEVPGLAWPGLRPGSRSGDEDAPECLPGEGVRARLARVRARQRGDRDDDPFGNVEDLRYPQLGADELAGASTSSAWTVRR